jgi:hypothetical protein
MAAPVVIWASLKLLEHTLGASFARQLASAEPSSGKVRFRLRPSYVPNGKVVAIGPTLAKTGLALLQ